VSNYYDKFYGYTGLFPILEEDHLDCSHTQQLRTLLANLPNARGSLFSRTGLVHGARFFILDDVVYNGHPTHEEHLQYNYLALSLTFDGELSALAERIAANAAEEWGEVFRHCYGFPATKLTSANVLQLLQQGQITTSFLYVDARGPLIQTLRALALQREVGFMLEQGQLLDTAGKRKLVQALKQRYAAMPDPVPGDFITAETLLK
jgi:hypothetical protein